MYFELGKFQLNSKYYNSWCTIVYTLI